MTTREFEPPVLDRIITRMVETTVEVPASTVYAYSELYIGGGDNLDAGTWRLESDTEIILALADDSGLGFPQDLELPFADVGVSWDGAEPTLLTLTALEIVRASPFTPIPVSTILTFDGPLPAAGAALSIGIFTGGTQTVTATTERKEWAARRDFRARDLTQSITGGVITVEDTRFIVRAGGPPWDEGDSLIDDKGVARTVEGTAQIGRGRFLELLARSIG